MAYNLADGWYLREIWKQQIKVPGVCLVPKVGISDTAISILGLHLHFQDVIYKLISYAD